MAHEDTVAYESFHEDWSRIGRITEGRQEFLANAVQRPGNKPIDVDGIEPVEEPEQAMAEVDGNVR